METASTKKSALEIRERRLIAQLCSENPSSDEIKWYEEQLRLFESENEDEAFQAMDNLIAGFGNQVTGKFLA